MWATPPALTFNGVVSTLATGALGSTPSGLAVDLSGNVYVADTANNRIVKVNSAGTASTLSVAGLTLNAPAGLTTDSSGNLYVADSGNSRVVEVTPGGSFSVIATTGYTLSGPQGVAVDTTGNIFISDTGNNRIIKVASGGTTSLVAPAGFTFSSPRGLAVDTYGDLFIADYGNSRVVEVVTAGTGSTVTGTPALGLSGPTGVSVSRNGTIYIVDKTAERVLIVDRAGADQDLLSGTVSLTTPTNVAISPAGVIYVEDSGGTSSTGRVQAFQTTSVGFGHVQLGGSGTTIALPFTVGASTTLSSVAVYTAGTQNLDFMIAGGTTCVASTTAADCVVNVTFAPTAAGLRKGALVLAYGSGSFTVPLSGTSDAPVAALSPGVASAVSNGGTPISISGAFHAAMDGAGNIYVTSYTGSTVTKIPAGGGSGTTVSTGGYTLASPTGVALDAAGNLFIADYGHNRIIEVTPDGTASLLTINGLPATTVGGVTAILHQPVSLNFDESGNLFIADYGSGRIIEVSPSLSGDGTVANGNGYVLSTGTYTFGQVNITGSTVDGNGNVYIADRNASPPVILKVDPLGTTTPVSLSPVSTLSTPYGIAADGFGNLYIMDSGHQRIVQVTTTGTASVMSFSGATLNINIFGITADVNGNMLVADFASNRLVRINVGQSAQTFSNTNVGSTSSAKTTTVTDLGNQDLVFSADPTYTANFSEYGSATNPCTSSTTLSTDDSCDVSIVFTPQSAGSLSTNITVTNNTLNVADSTQQIAVSGTGVSAADTTAVVVTTNPTSANIGQPLTVSATVSDTAAGHTSIVPTGEVSFTDTVGTTVVSLNGGNPVTLSSGVATLTGVTLSGAGSHTITANYVGVSGSFLASSNTTTLTVSKTPVTVAGPSTQPVQVTVGQAGSVQVTVTGPYSALAVPSGSISYSVLDASSNAVASGTASLTVSSTNSSATVPITNSLAAGNYTVSVTYGGDDNYAASGAATTVEVAIGLITPRVSLISSNNPAFVSSSVTFTATVSATTGTPSGTVGFYDGTRLLGSSTLSSGTASYTTSTLAVGTHSITAAYRGDTTFSAATSSAVSQRVADFTVSTASGGTSSATASAGGTASYSLLVSPPSGTTFPSAVTFSVSGLPSGAVATFSPRSLAAGARATNVTLSIQLPTQVASRRSLNRMGVLAVAFLPMMGGLLFFAGGRIRPMAGKHARMLRPALLLLACSAVMMLIGCNAVSRHSQSYTLTVTATCGSLSHSTTLSLSVQ